MAENSILWTTSGTGDGSAGGYSMSQMVTWMQMLFTRDNTSEGVADGYGNELEVTNPSGRNLSVNTGGALCYGFPYWNTAPVTLTLRHPTSGTTGWRVVLRASWAAQTVRLALLEASDGTATPPAVTQTANTTWEISIAYGTITTGDVIAITDDRDYIHSTTEVTPAMIANRTRYISAKPIALYYAGHPEYAYEVAGAVAVVHTVDYVGASFAFQVPADFVSGAKVRVLTGSSGTGNVYIQPVFYCINRAADDTATLTNSWETDSIAAAYVWTPQIAVSDAALVAGSIVYGYIWRRGTHANDTLNDLLLIAAVEFEYTADS